MSDPRQDLVPMRDAASLFDTVRFGGYARHQVDDTVQQLRGDLQVTQAERDAALDRSSDLAAERASLQREIDQLRRKAVTAVAPSFNNMGERIGHMLQLAEEEAAELRRSAEEETTALRTATLEEAEGLRQRVAAEETAAAQRLAAANEEAERLVAEARQHAEQIAAKAQTRADDLVHKAQERVARLDADSQARRTKIEEDFEIAQRARRSEAARLEQERAQASAAAAQQRIAAAEQHAARVVAEAEGAAGRVQGVRDDLLDRLAGVHHLLTQLPDLTDRLSGPGPQAREEGATQPADPSAPSGQTEDAPDAGTDAGPVRLGAPDRPAVPAQQSPAQPVADGPPPGPNAAGPSTVSIAVAAEAAPSASGRAGAGPGRPAPGSAGGNDVADPPDAGADHPGTRVLPAASVAGRPGEPAGQPTS